MEAFIIINTYPEGSAGNPILMHEFSIFLKLGVDVGKDYLSRLDFFLEECAHSFFSVLAHGYARVALVLPVEMEYFNFIHGRRIADRRIALLDCPAGRAWGFGALANAA